MTIRETPNLDAMADELYFLREVEDTYRRLKWYREHPGTTGFPFLEDYPVCGFLEEYTRLKDHYSSFTSLLYGGVGDPYNPPTWLPTPQAQVLWRRAHELMSFDDSE